MKKILFIDRDGTIIEEPKDTFQIDSLELLDIRPKAIRNLYKIATELDFDLAIVSNQDGLGTDAYPQASFDLVQNKMIKILENEGITFKAVHIDDSFEHENKPTRKPNIGMLQQYMTGEYDLKNSFVIGDRETDQVLANNLGCKCIIIKNHQNPDDFKAKADFVVEDWDQIFEILKK